MLVTHWGLSGPSILKLSAWGARMLHALDYKFDLLVNWLPNTDVEKRLIQIREEWSKRSVTKRSPFENIPRRLWERLVTSSGIEAGSSWSQVNQKSIRALTEALQACRFQVDGKSLNKDEFVTCGGIPLKEVDFRTMQSKITPGLYFAGEILDVDGITGGFNFQNAWTTGHLAGKAIAEATSEHSL